MRRSCRLSCCSTRKRRLQLTLCPPDQGMQEQGACSQPVATACRTLDSRVHYASIRPGVHMQHPFPDPRSGYSDPWSVCARLAECVIVECVPVKPCIRTHSSSKSLPWRITDIARILCRPRLRMCRRTSFWTGCRRISGDAWHTHRCEHGTCLHLLHVSSLLRGSRQDW